MAAPPPSLKDEKRALWYLRKIPLLEGLSTDQYRELIGLVEVRELQRRQIVYLPGDPGEHVFFIQGGRIKCSKVSRDGKELTLTYVAAGEFFGELCVLEGQPREEMAEAMKNSIITLLPREKICALLEAESHIAFRFIKVIGDRRRSMETKIEQLVFRDVHAKLAALLLELGREYGKDTEDGVQIDVKITHQEMANLIGSTRETISLTLAAFKRKELIQLNGRTVVLTDQEGLTALT
ncbi:MAG TPA: Crp/Fnr family transcriptional regulator [Nannocystis sp.]|jgi:CRP-like cAMP-binding protein